MSSDLGETPQDLERLGYAVVSQGWLAQLRDYLGLSRNALAEMVGTSAVTLKRWESGEVRVWAKSAQGLGRFYLDALQGLEKLTEAGHDPADLVLLSRVPGMLGIGSSVDVKKHFPVVELGVLGEYTIRSKVKPIAGLARQ